LSADLPSDLVIYGGDGLKIKRHVNLPQESPYYRAISKQWGEHLRQGFAELPDPAWETL